MANYSGTTSFDFEIERYRSAATAELVLPDNVPSDAKDEDFIYELINLTVEGRAYFAEGRMHCLPENSFPDEGEAEIMSAIGPDGKDWEEFLSKSEREIILDNIIENVASSGDDRDFSDYGDEYGY